MLKLEQFRFIFAVVVSSRNLLKWRLKVKSDLEKSDQAKEEARVEKVSTKEHESENEEEKLENEITSALYEENKLDKKFVQLKSQNFRFKYQKIIKIKNHSHFQKERKRSCKKKRES